jgi:hypothetical protein
VLNATAVRAEKVSEVRIYQGGIKYVGGKIAPLVCDKELKVASLAGILAEQTVSKGRTLGPAHSGPSIYRHNF